jgi:Putative MetA-pathway of phenol degradation
MQSQNSTHACFEFKKEVFKMKSIIYLLAFMSCVYLSQSQIVADRPSASASAVTVPEGGIQIESGFAYGQYKQDFHPITKTINLPSTLIRYGMSDIFEFRVAFDFQIDSYDDFIPVSLGMKYSIAKENGWIPDMAILSHFNIDYKYKRIYVVLDKSFNEIGQFEDDFLDNSIDVRMAFAYSLPMDFAFGGNFGAILWRNLDDDRKLLENSDARYFDLYEWTANLEYSAFDNLAFYSELFGDFNSDEARTNLNIGVKFLATQNMQLDAFYIKVLSLPESEKWKYLDYWQFGFGFSYLWD